VKSQVVQLRPQGSRRRQFRGLISFLLDQLPTKFLRRQLGIQTPIAKLGIRLTETLGDVSDVVQQTGQLFFRTRPPTQRYGIATGDPGPQFVHSFANRNTAPTKLRFGAALSATSERLRRSSHEQPTFVPSQHLGRFDNVGFEPVREFHDFAPSIVEGAL